MSETSKSVDGFHFMPPALRAWISKDIPDQPFSGKIPWTPLDKSISETTFTLMTTAGISMKSDPPFDMEREKVEPAWGDPSYREIPRTASESDIEVSHLHINTEYIKQDINVMLPLTRFQEFEKEGIIGKLTPTCYSYYGFQLDPTALLNETMPKVADRMRHENVEAVLLTPA
ncbi:MAG: glycine/sarcosine/betaine reductase selenoprotein B family protein [Desulfobacterales bacterium]|jgi:D-proline reductase (dithiol) PrdB